MFGNELFVFLHRVAHWSKTLHIIVFFPFVQQGNFDFCETIPGFISGLFCAYVPLYPKFCSDVCESADDDDDDDTPLGDDDGSQTYVKYPLERCVGDIPSDWVQGCILDTGCAFKSDDNFANGCWGCCSFQDDSCGVCDACICDFEINR